jgi:diguanylate cyclase (GGDEF)-like protein
MVLLIVTFFTMRFAGHLTKPLLDLTEAAKEVNKGNFNFTLDYNENDEIGTLANTFRQLVQHVKDHISDLNKKVYVDALTSVRNKGAFTAYIQNLQNRLDSSEEPVEFAVGVFDCDNLKLINDQFGHDKGDIYLKTASRLICRVFQHSPVFRIGGDEFAVVLQNEDYKNRDELVSQFIESSKEIRTNAEKDWDQVNVTLGLAVYDPQTDGSVNDVARRADQLMYENKRIRKANHNTTV